MDKSIALYTFGSVLWKVSVLIFTAYLYTIMRIEFVFFFVALILMPVIPAFERPVKKG